MNMNHSESNLQLLPKEKEWEKETQKDMRETDDDIRPLEFAELFKHVEV